MAAIRIIIQYNLNAKSLHQLEEIIEKANAVNQDMMAFCGVGNHGGGLTLQGELQHHPRGYYIAETTIKKSNRKCGGNLIAAYAFIPFGLFSDHGRAKGGYSLFSADFMV